MTLPRFQSTVTTDTGDVVPGATVTVKLESTGLNAVIFEDRAGVISLANPFVTDNDGKIIFYAAPDEYRITAVGGSGSDEFRFFPLVGTAALADEGTNPGELPPSEDVLLLTGIGTAPGEVATNAQRDTLDAAKPTRKNFIINGAMAVNQEQSGNLPLVVGSSPAFPFDQFECRNTTGTGTITASEQELNGSKSLRLAATAAVTDLTGANNVKIQQNIEAQNVFHLNGLTVTQSFRVKTNWTGNLAIAFRNSDDTRCFIVDYPVVNGVEDLVDIPALLEAATILTNDNESGFSVNIGFCNEGTLQSSAANNDQWQAGNFRCSDGSTQWAKTINNYVEITQVQLEEGDKATAFEHKLYSDYFDDCIWYAYEINPQLTNYTLCGSISGQSYRQPFFFPKPMRIGPTIISGTIKDGAGSDVTGDITFLNSFTSEMMIRGGINMTTARLTTDQNMFLDARL